MAVGDRVGPGGAASHDRLVRRVQSPLPGDDMAFERQAFGVSPPIPSDRERYVDAAPFEGAFVTPTIRLVRALARGGMGSVWLAEHLALGAPVAVKFMSEATVESCAARELFQQEAAALAKIRSPHVVQVFDFGVTSASLPYIVMELLEGETLQDRIERFGRLSPRLTVEIVRQLGLARLARMSSGSCIATSSRRTCSWSSMAQARS